MSKRIVFNVSFFELDTDMQWCLFGNSGSIASKLSIIAINPGHFYVKSRWLSRFYCRKAYLSSIRSFAILYLFIMSLDKKMHLHKFAPGQIFCKIVKTEESMWVNAPFAWLFTPPVFFGMQMCHLPSLPHIYSSGFTFLRHIYKEQICANPFFFLQWVMLSILSLWCSKKRNVISWAEGDRSKIGWCVGTSQEECNRKILFSTEY